MRIAGSLQLGLVLGLCSGLASSCALAAGDIVVKPSTLQETGWVVATQHGDDTTKVQFCAGPTGQPAGAGSVLLSVGAGPTGSGQEYTDPLPKAYLGTNALSGIRLDRITQLKFWVCPASWTWAGAQPVTVELALGKQDELRLCTFRPWGFTPTGFYGKMTWQQFDLMGEGGAWEVTNTSAPLTRGDWTWLVARYPGASIATPPTRDWPFGTISGTGLNVKIGSGKAVGKFRKAAQWWKESDGCSAYVDKLTVGYRGNDGLEIIKDFDFEPESL